MDITNYMKAGYPAIYINTIESDRAIKSIRADGYRIFSWDCLRGIMSADSQVDGLVYNKSDGQMGDALCASVLGF